MVYLPRRPFNKVNMTTHLRTLLLLLFFFGANLLSENCLAVAKDRAVSFTDALGKKIDITAPVERVITINTSSAIILRAIGVDIGKTIVGVTEYITKNPRFWPRLKEKPSFKFTNLNYERLAELKPQLIILYKNSYLTADENKLASLGAKWVYMDCTDPRTIDDDIRLLGRLFEKQEKAEELISWRQKQEHLISSRVDMLAPEAKPNVFFYTFVQTNLDKRIYTTINKKSCSHPLIEIAGGINMGVDLPREYRQVSGEWIVKCNPDIIVGGVIAKTTCGYNADENDAYENLKDFYQKMQCDPTFKIVNAVKQNRILLIAQDLKEGPASVVGTAYIAKFLHPDKFMDINPDAVLKEYHEKWCGLPHRGVYVYPPYKGIYAFPEKPVGEKSRVKTITITDSAGRDVVVPQPLKRIAGLQTSACNAFSLLQLDDHVVGITEYIWNDPTGYPRLNKKPNIGSVYTPNYEMIAQVRPQVVFMGTASVNLDPAVQKLAPMGVAVAAFDFQPMKGDDAYAREAHYNKELLMLGSLTGREERASAFVRWKTGILDLMRQRTKGIEKKRVLGINSVAQVLKQNSFKIWAGKRIIELAGGIDYTANLNAREINGEWIVEQNPEVIILASYWLEEGLGYGVTNTIKVRETYQKAIQNSVISQTRACKTGKVYLFGYYGLASGGQTALGALYLAKRLYPEQFSDIDPETYHREYLEKWLNINYQGVWFYP